MSRAEEQVAARRRAERESSAQHEAETDSSAMLLRRPNLGGRGNGSARTQVLLDMQQSHGNRAVHRVHSTFDSSQRVAVQRTPRETLATLRHAMSDIPGNDPALDYIKRQMGIEDNMSMAHAPGELPEIVAAQDALTGDPPLDWAPPMVPYHVLTPDPHRDFPGEGVPEYRDVSPSPQWELWELVEIVRREQQRRELAPSGWGGWGGINVSNPAGDLMSR